MDIELTLSHGAIHSGIVYNVDGILSCFKGLIITKGVPLPQEPCARLFNAQVRQVRRVKVEGIKVEAWWER